VHKAYDSGYFRPLSGIALLAAIAFSLLSPASPVSAHAEPERGDPPINGRVETPPKTLQVWFSEEVATNSAKLQVTGPDGSVVDLGDTAVDLYDPEHKHVTVSLKSGLSAGNYVVQWSTVSVEDGDEATGYYGFYIEQGDASASPVAGASPAAGGASPVASPAVVTPAPTVQPTAEPTVAPSPTATVSADATEEGDFDGQAFAISVGAGVAAAIAIFLFWRAVKPKQKA
jgi:methionine-rich copper-binding protein CopC